MCSPHFLYTSLKIECTIFGKKCIYAVIFFYY